MAVAVKYKYVNNVKISDLLLDAENPRFASSALVRSTGTFSQSAIIEHLLRYSDVVQLANRINSVQELHGSELITCYEKDGDYVVIEGNRRTCACKLLLNRELIPAPYEPYFPKITDRTKENIEEITINLYPNKESVQAYLSDRHIKGIIKWSSLEKNNYYMNLFSQYKNVKEIMNFTPDSEQKIRDSIIKYQFFMDVFNELKTRYKSISIEDLDYLPLVRKFMNTLIGNDKDVGLDLEFNEDSLKYFCPEDKKEIYKTILWVVGEAFLIRKDKMQCKDRMQCTDKSKCTQENPCRIVATELNKVDDQKRLILDDKRIHGLYSLIKEYKGIVDNIDSEESNDKPSGESEGSSPKDTDSKGAEDETKTKGRNSDPESPSDNNDTVDPEPNTSNGKASAPNNTAKGSGNTNNLPYFFTGLRYGHLSPNDPLTHGITRICNEIRLFSSNKIVGTYPLSAAFLTRALIEHSLIYYSKRNTIQGQQVLIWEQVSDNGKVPKLSELVKRYNKNLSNYIKDSNMRSYFKSLFQDYSNTASPLNWVIHRPEEYTIPENDLVQLPGKGLLVLINYLIS